MSAHRRVLDNVVRALAPAAQTEFRFTVIGGGGRLGALKSPTEALGLQNVEFIGPVPPVEMNAHLITAHVHLVTHRRPSVHRDGSSKLQSPASLGLPILAVAPGEAADLVSRAEAGVTVNPGDPGCWRPHFSELPALPD